MIIDYIKSNKEKIFFYLILFIILFNIILNEPNVYNILVLLLFISSSIIIYFSKQTGFDFILNNRIILLILNSLIIITIIHYIQKILSNNVLIILNSFIFILLITLIYRYISFSNKLKYNHLNSILNKSNSYYHTKFFINPFGFYFWYHILVLFIFMSLFFIDWKFKQKMFFAIFIFIVVFIIDFLYFKAKPYQYFN